MVVPETPVPVTLLTGFLGAGKTTLLNRLLHDPTAGRVAVIVNEFGAAGLDHDLIEAAAEEIVLMEQGCLCCTIRGDLSRTLGDLLDRRAAGAVAFDRVVIETTGLADPGPVHHTLLLDPGLAGRTRLDGIVTAVDLALGARTLDTRAEAQAQAAMADLIVLTKADRADAAARAAVAARLDRLNPGARRIEARHGAVPPGALFGAGLPRPGSDPLAALAWIAAPRAPDPLAGLSGLSLSPPAATAALLIPGSGAPAHHAREGDIAAAALHLDAPLTLPAFDAWCGLVTALLGPNLLRLKAILHLDGFPNPFAVHGVQHVFDPPVPLPGWPEGRKAGRVVLIARDAPRAELDALLGLLAAADPAGGAGAWPGQTPAPARS